MWKILKKFFFRFRKFISKAIQDKKLDELDLQTCAFQLIPEWLRGFVNEKFLHIAIYIYKFEETDLGEEIHNDATDHQKGIWVIFTFIIKMVSYFSFLREINTGNVKIFLPLRFYVKSNLTILGSQKVQFCPF